jgi:hypothetical protein
MTICNVAAVKRIVNSTADDSIVSKNGRNKVGTAQSKLILHRPTSQSKPGLSFITLISAALPFSVTVFKMLKLFDTVIKF